MMLNMKSLNILLFFTCLGIGVARVRRSEDSAGNPPGTSTEALPGIPCRSPPRIPSVPPYRNPPGYPPRKHRPNHPPVIPPLPPYTVPSGISYQPPPGLPPGYEFASPDVQMPSEAPAGVDCGLPDGVDPPGAAGGVRAQFREASWHAGLYTKTTRPYMQICGGTIITRTAVITAAHCFTKDRNIPPASQYAVAAGKIYRPFNNPEDKGAEKTDVAEIKIPPRYQGAITNFQEDIAVVIVTTAFNYSEFIQPACVSFRSDFDEDQLQEGKIAKFVGWGQTGPNTAASQVLQAISVPSIAIDKCIEQSPPSFRSAITSDKICAGYNNGTAVCHGDSGGGLVFIDGANGDGRIYLRGVASTSPPDENSCNIYTWATFTHLLRHQHFIEKHVPRVEEACFQFDIAGDSTEYFPPPPEFCPCPSETVPPTPQPL